MGTPAEKVYELAKKLIRCSTSEMIWRSAIEERKTHELEKTPQVKVVDPDPPWML